MLDLSRNRSRRFCSTTCGNRNAVAAYRARQPRSPDSRRSRSGEEPPEDLEEDLRLLGVDPVAGALDRDAAVVREPAVHGGDVVRCTYRRSPPPPTASCPRTARRRRARRSGQPPRTARSRPSTSRLGRQDQPSSAVEVLQEEAAHRAARAPPRPARRRRRGGARGAPRSSAEHRLDVAGELAAPRVVDRRHVDDAEPLDQFGVAQREHHRGLAAHRVPDQCDRVVGREQLGDPVGDVDVVEVVGPLATGRGGACRRASTRWSAARSLPMRGPVLALAEQSVAEGDQRSLLASTVWSGDVFSTSAHSRRRQVAVAQHDRQLVAVVRRRSTGSRPRGTRRAPPGRRSRRRRRRTRVAPALLGDREVEADPGAVVAREVLLPGGEAGAVGAAHQQPRVGERVAALEQAVAAGEGVEVVELDGVEPVVGAARRSSGRRSAASSRALGAACVRRAATRPRPRRSRPAVAS